MVPKWYPKFQNRKILCLSFLTHYRTSSYDFQSHITKKLIFHKYQNFDLWVKNFQKSKIFKNLKKHHFSTFVVFLLLFGQSGLSCPILRPRNFYMPWGYPLKIEKIGKNEHYLSRLKWQKFLSKIQKIAKKWNFRHIFPTYFRLSLFHQKFINIRHFQFFGRYCVFCWIL